MTAIGEMQALVRVPKKHDALLRVPCTNPHGDMHALVRVPCINPHGDMHALVRVPCT